MNDKNIFLSAQCSDISQSSIQDAIIKCLSNPCYRVGVYTSSLEEIKQVRESFISEWKNICRLYATEIIDYQYINCSSEYVWKFANASLIKIIICRENVRGYRFNSAIISGSVSPESIRNIIYPCLRDYNTSLRRAYIFSSRKESERLIAENNIVHEYYRHKQNTDFINEDTSDCEDNHELNEFLNSFRINKNT